MSFLVTKLYHYSNMLQFGTITVLNLRSCGYWSAVLASRQPGQSTNIFIRTILKLLNCVEEYFKYKMGSILTLLI
jgi:hypothetical protein